jgi:hypothetical protein
MVACAVSLRSLACIRLIAKLLAAFAEYDVFLVCT